MEFEVEVKVVEEPIISEIIMPEEKPDEFIEFDQEMSNELGYKSIKFNLRINQPRLILKTIDDKEIVVPNEVVTDKLLEILNKAVIYEEKNK
jgi:hypothetical protein